MSVIRSIAVGIDSGISYAAAVTRNVVISTRMVFARSTSGFTSFGRSRFDFRSEVGDPATNSIVGAVVGWMARNFPEAPVRVTKVQPDGTVESVAPGIAGAGAMLRLLEKPNAYFSGVAQWMATLVDYVQGDAYWVKVRGAQDRVVELWWVPRAMMEPRWPVEDPTVFISHYDMKLGDRTEKIEPRNVVHFRNGINPKNVRKGVSRLDPLWREIFTDNEAAQFTSTLLYNLGVPGLTVSPANTATNFKGDAEEIKQRVMERTQGDRRGEPMVFTIPTEVKVLAFSPQAMDLKALRRIPEERVAAQLGVPAGVAQLGAGLDRSTFTNYSEANRAAYTQCLIPLGRLLAAELEVQLLPEFEDVERGVWDVSFDYSQTEAMAEAAESIWKRNEGAATKGLITRADFKRAVKLPVRPEDEVYIMPNNYVATPSNPTARPVLLARPAPSPPAPADAASVS